MHDALFLTLAIDPRAREPKFAQLYHQIREMIEHGKIKTGARLPASRSFAAELGISRTTVVNAYNQLIAEGFVEGKRGASLRVCQLEFLPLDAKGPANPPARPRPRTSPSGHPRAFRPGTPDMRLFPAKAWAKTMARTARTSPTSLITTEEAFGDRPLRRAISQHLAQWRGFQVEPERIMITAGAEDALEIIARTLVKPGDSVALEEPGYPPFQRLANHLQLKTCWLKTGESGAELPGPGLSPLPRLVLLTPSHQFPLGGTMPMARRQAFLAMAEAQQSWIIEDDFDSEFRYAGRPIPSLASLDPSGRVIYLGTFSKVFSRGLRLGYLVVPEGQEGAFEATLTKYGSKTSVSAQRPLANFMEAGEFHRHLRRMRRIYGGRRQAFLALVRQELGDLVRFTDHQAGMIITLYLNNIHKLGDDRSLARQASWRGVDFLPLSSFYAGSCPKGGMVMGFCGFSEAEMEAPMKQIAHLLSHQTQDN